MKLLINLFLSYEKKGHLVNTIEVINNVLIPEFRFLFTYFAMLVFIYFCKEKQISTISDNYIRREVLEEKGRGSYSGI